MKVLHKFRLKWGEPDPEDAGLYLIRTEDLEIPISHLACLESSIRDLSRKYRAAHVNFLGIESLEPHEDDLAEVMGYEGQADD